MTTQKVGKRKRAAKFTSFASHTRHLHLSKSIEIETSNFRIHIKFVLGRFLFRIVGTHRHLHAHTHTQTHEFTVVLFLLGCSSSSQYVLINIMPSISSFKRLLKIHRFIYSHRKYTPKNYANKVVKKIKLLVVSYTHSHFLSLFCNSLVLLLPQLHRFLYAYFFVLFSDMCVGAWWASFRTARAA